MYTHRYQCGVGKRRNVRLLCFMAFSLLYPGLLFLELKGNTRETGSLENGGYCAVPQSEIKRRKFLAEFSLLNGANKIWNCDGCIFFIFVYSLFFLLFFLFFSFFSTIFFRRDERENVIFSLLVFFWQNVKMISIKHLLFLLFFSSFCDNFSSHFPHIKFHFSSLSSIERENLLYDIFCFSLFLALENIII